jgi:hypothetical protein
MRNRNIDEAELRRLMAPDDGREAADPREVTAVAALLSAAAGLSGRASEADPATGPLPGEEAALAAFRAAQPAAAAHSPAPARRRLEWLRPGRRGRTVTFAMAFAALLGSGVAVAAGVTGHMTLPLPFHHPQPTQSATPTPSASASTSASMSEPASHPPASHTTPQSGDPARPEPTTTPQPPRGRAHDPHHPAEGQGHGNSKDHSHSPSPHATGNEGHHKTHSNPPSHQPTLPPNAGHPHTKQSHTRCHDPHHPHEPATHDQAAPCNPPTPSPSPPPHP